MIGKENPHQVGTILFWFRTIDNISSYPYWILGILNKNYYDFKLISKNQIKYQHDSYTFEIRDHPINFADRYDDLKLKQNLFGSWNLFIASFNEDLMNIWINDTFK